MSGIYQGKNPTISTADGAIVDGASSSIKATVLDYTSSNPLAVRLTDTNGDYIAAGAGTQYTEDAAAAANPVGTAVNLIRADTPATITNADGDNVAQRGTNYGAAYVQIVSSAGSFVDSFGGGTQYTEGDTDASITGTALMFESNTGTNAISVVSNSTPLPISDAGGAITVDGTVAATQSGTWNITNVSGTVSLPTGAATAANQTTIIGHVDGIEGLLTTIDADTGNIATSTASIDGKITACNTGAVVISSSALPSGASTSAKQDTIIGHVDGIETVLGTIDADTGNISTKIDTIAGAVSGTEMQVDVLTMPTTTVQATNLDIRDLTSVSDSVSAVQSGTWTVTANAGTNLNTSTLALESGGNLAAIATSASVLDDWDESDRAKVNLIVGQAGIAAGVGATGATVPRVVIANDQGKTLLSAGGSASSSGNNTLVAAGTNKLKVYAFSLTTTSTTAMTCIFQSGAGGTELWRVVLQAPTSVSTGANLAVTPPAYLFATASATLLNLNLSSANAVHYSISYYDEA